MPINILIVESDKTIAEPIQGHLTRFGYSSVVAADVLSAWQLMSVVLPDVVLLNWILRKESGANLANQMRLDSDTKHVPIVMLGYRSSKRRSAAGFHEELVRDADGYVSNPGRYDDVSSSIGSALRQRQIPRLTDEPVSVGGLSLNPATRQVYGNREGTQIILTVGPTELRLLYFFMTHPERVYTKAELLGEVWGDQSSIDQKTVSTYVKRLRTALRPAGRDYSIQAVRSFGYRFAP
jgi:two-component system phosphate regulon response regulator PhoB